MKLHFHDILYISVCLLLTACGTTQVSLVDHGNPDFSVPPRVIILEGQRYLEFQFESNPEMITPAIRFEKVGDEVHCYGHIYVRNFSSQPRLKPIHETGPVFWLNPDGTKVQLTGPENL